MKCKGTAPSLAGACLLMTIAGVVLLSFGLSSYSEVTCSISVIEYIPSSNSKYTAILNVITGNKTQKVIYPYWIDFNEQIGTSKCYIHSCTGVNCPLVTLNKLDTQVIVGIILITVFSVLLFFCFVWLSTKESGPTIERIPLILRNPNYGIGSSVVRE